MDHLIKAQLLKHLAKFFKNLSPDSLKWSTIKGFCELHQLEFNEFVLMDLLELPVWLNISKATCSHVIMHIPWTKLKTLPVRLALDEVVVELETCEKFRDYQTQTSHNSSSTKYGWSDRVIDGATVTIDSIIIKFNSSVFKASFQLSLIVLESRAPNWKPVSNLRSTFYKDSLRGLILNFKHIEWQILKIEAQSEEGSISAPLRFITCKGSCRLMIKKRIKDCQVVGARIIVLFDDILWVLTDAMLLSAFHLVNHLNDLIKKAPLTKNLNSNEENLSLIKNKKQLNDKKLNLIHTENVFAFETSYHLIINCLQLQLYDDLNPENCRSSLPFLKEGGSLHLLFNKLVIDLYPYHKTVDAHNHWLKYSDPSPNRQPWIQDHLITFVCKNLNKDQALASSICKRYLSEIFSSVFLIRVGNYRVNCISIKTKSKSNRKFGSGFEEKAFLTTGKFSNDLPAFYLEYNQYFYYEFGSTRISTSKRAPDPTLFINIAPLILLFDSPTLLWLNILYSHLHKSLLALRDLIPDSNLNTSMLSRIEILMPTLITSLGSVLSSQDSFRKSESFQFKCARISISNSFKDLFKNDSINCLFHAMANSSLFIKVDKYPWLKCNESKAIVTKFIELVKILEFSKAKHLSHHNQLWLIDCDHVWLEAKKLNSTKFISLIEPFQITLWAYFSSEIVNFKNSLSSTVQNNLNVVFKTSSTIKIKIEHHHFVFLMRLLEYFEEFNKVLITDKFKTENKHKKIISNSSPQICFSSIIQNLELEIILNYQRCSTKPLLSTSNSSSEKLNAVINCNPSNNQQSNSPKSLPISSSKNTFPNVLSSTQFVRKSDSFQKLSSIYFPLNQAIIRSESSSLLGDSNCGTGSTNDENSVSLNDEEDESIFSDKSDNEKFLLVGIESFEDDDFYFNDSKLIEEAVEATEASISKIIETASKPTDLETNSALQTDDISSISFIRLTLNDITLVKKSKGFHSSLLVQASNIKINEYNDIYFQDYKENTFCESIISHKENDAISSVSVRLDTVLSPDFKIDLISVILENFEASLDKVSMLKLSDFFDDPEASVVTPMFLLFKNVSFKIIDAKSKAPPICINLVETLIKKSSQNVITLDSLSTKDGDHKLIKSHCDLLTSAKIEEEDLSDKDLSPIIMLNANIFKEIDNEDTDLKLLLKL